MVDIGPLVAAIVVVSVVTFMTNPALYILFHQRSNQRVKARRFMLMALHYVSVVLSGLVITFSKAYHQTLPCEVPSILLILSAAFMDSATFLRSWHLFTTARFYNKIENWSRVVEKGLVNEAEKVGNLSKFSKLNPWKILLAMFTCVCLNAVPSIVVFEEWDLSSLGYDHPLCASALGRAMEVYTFFYLTMFLTMCWHVFALRKSTDSLGMRKELHLLLVANLLGVIIPFTPVWEDPNLFAFMASLFFCSFPLIVTGVPLIGVRKDQKRKGVNMMETTVYQGKDGEAEFKNVS